MQFLFYFIAFRPTKRANALVECLGGGMRSFFGIRTNFEMPLNPFLWQNPAKSTSTKGWAAFPGFNFALKSTKKRFCSAIFLLIYGKDS
jgi:hypothetical protein